VFRRFRAPLHLKEVNLNKRTKQIESIDVIANDFFFLLFLNISCRIALFEGQCCYFGLTAKTLI
jgi:hypothetical protein